MHEVGNYPLPVSKLRLPTIPINKAFTFTTTVIDGELGELDQEKKVVK